MTVETEILYARRWTPVRIEARWPGRIRRIMRADTLAPIPAACLNPNESRRLVRLLAEEYRYGSSRTV